REAINKINGRLKLNVGMVPDWSPLVALLGDSRLRLAELEWLPRPVSDLREFVRRDSGFDVVGWGRVAPEPVIEALIALLKDENRDVRSRAAISLGQLGESNENVIEALIALLKDQDRDVRDSAAYALGQLGESNENVIEALIALLKDQGSDVRDSAAYA